MSDKTSKTKNKPYRKGDAHRMTDKDIYLSRTNVKTGSQDGKAFEFCLQNNILGVGWCLRNTDGTPYIPTSIEECEKKGSVKYDSCRGFVV